MKKFLRVLLCISTGLFLMSQTCNAGLKVHGNVSDQAGDAIIGAAITVKGTTKGVISDVDGNYKFGESDGIARTKDHLICSSMGYETEEKKATEIVNFTLKEDGGLWDTIKDIIVVAGTIIKTFK